RLLYDLPLDTTPQRVDPLGLRLPPISRPLRIRQRLPHDVDGAPVLDPDADGVHWLLQVLLFSEDIRQIWNQGVAIPYHRALRTVRAGRRLSLIPRFD